MALFKKKEERTEEQKKQDKKETTPHIEEANIGGKEEQKEVTLDQIISLNTEAWYRAQILEQLNEHTIALGSINANIQQLIEEIKKK